MVYMVTLTEARSFEISKLKNSLEKSSSLPGVNGVCDPSKLHLPQSQVSLREGKTFHYKVFSKFYCNGELNFFINLNLILSALKYPKANQS